MPDHIMRGCWWRTSKLCVADEALTASRLATGSWATRWLFRSRWLCPRSLFPCWALRGRRRTGGSGGARNSAVRRYGGHCAFDIHYGSLYADYLYRSRSPRRSSAGSIWTSRSPKAAAPRNMPGVLKTARCSGCRATTSWSSCCWPERRRGGSRDAGDPRRLAADPAAPRSAWGHVLANLMLGATIARRPSPPAKAWSAVSTILFSNWRFSLREIWSMCWRRPGISTAYEAHWRFDEL